VLEGIVRTQDVSPGPDTYRRQRSANEQAQAEMAWNADGNGRLRAIATRSPSGMSDVANVGAATKINLTSQTAAGNLMAPIGLLV
jgi:hypothetical protein